VYNWSHESRASCRGNSRVWEGSFHIMKLAGLEGVDGIWVTFGEDGGFTCFEGGGGDGEDEFVAWLVCWVGHV